MTNPNKPNILIFLCDQLRSDILKCYGGGIVKTPNIDALAGESTVFTEAFTPTAICSPARASLMTGLYPHSHHMFNNSTPLYSYCEHLSKEHTMIQDWADSETDYETAYFGKWHIGSAQDLFDSKFHVTHPRPYDGGPFFLSSSHWHPGRNMGELTCSMAEGRAGEVDMPMDEFPDVAAAGYAGEFLRNRKKDKPFLAFCSFPGPHAPLLIPKEFGVRYDSSHMQIWPNMGDTLKNKPVSQKKRRLLEAENGSGIRNEKYLKESLACYFSYVELIDSMIGEVVAALKETGDYDNTVIIFTADHGEMIGSHGFMIKGNHMYNETYKIPLLIRVPGAPCGNSGALVNLMDITATLFHIMSGQPLDYKGNNTLHGESLIPVIKRETAAVRSINYCQYHADWYGHHTSRMVTDGRWKVIWNLDDLGEMYDLAADPHEMDNLFYSTGCRDIRNKYLESMMEQALQFKDEQAYRVKQINPGVEDKLHDMLLKEFANR